MQTVAVAAALHDAACLLVYNLDLVLVDYVFYILLKEGVSLEELGDGVHALGLDGVVGKQGVLLGGAFLHVGDVLQL